MTRITRITLVFMFLYLFLSSHITYASSARDTSSSGNFLYDISVTFRSGDIFPTFYIDSVYELVSRQGLLHEISTSHENLGSRIIHEDSDNYDYVRSIELYRISRSLQTNDVSPNFYIDSVSELVHLQDLSHEILTSWERVYFSELPDLSPREILDDVAISTPLALSYASPAISSSPFDALFFNAAVPRVRPHPGSVDDLGDGEHAWVSRPLPDSVYDLSERRCLALAVYFEARSEPLLGQRAVAQVVLNRVKSAAYPDSICEVVYQGYGTHGRKCQFSFACDGVSERIYSEEHWRTASKVANDAVYGRAWIKSVGTSSHYHADYVRPRWRRSMQERAKIGRHIFYRTRDGRRG